jgi:hypothetical protein
MRERWFADDRDLVKWATLMTLAEQHALRSITQVAYRRADDTQPAFEIDGVQHRIPSAVWTFFRDLSRIRSLGAEAGCAVDVVEEPFVWNRRREYIDAVLRHLSRAPRPRLLFLDPDTGLQPGSASAEHTTRAEVTTYWGALDRDEWIVLYQHARRTRTWIDDVEAELRTLCSDGPVTRSRSREVGKDVVFYALRKP